MKIALIKTADNQLKFLRVPCRVLRGVAAYLFNEGRLAEGENVIAIEKFDLPPENSELIHLDERSFHAVCKAAFMMGQKLGEKERARFPVHA